MVSEIDEAISKLVKAIDPGNDADSTATMTLAVLNLVKARETLAHSIKNN